MVCQVRSLGLWGVQGYEVTAECDLSNGLPNFDIVGLPDTAVKEARERVRAAAKNGGFAFPISRITVNLAPADRRKGGTVYDLPIWVGILTAAGQLPERLRPVPGVLPMALAAVRAGVKELYVPAANAPEATLADGLSVYPVPDVAALAAHLRGETPLQPAPKWQPGQRQVHAGPASALHPAGYDTGGGPGRHGDLLDHGHDDSGGTHAHPAPLPRPSPHYL